MTISIRSCFLQGALGLPGLLAAALASAEVQEECLQIEEAFALNRIEQLRSLQPQQPRWRALRAFRLAAAYIPMAENRAARAAIREGLRAVADAEDAESLYLAAMLDGEFLLIDPWRFPFNGVRALRRLNRAEALGSDSPRSALIRGTAKVVLPGVLGGDAREAIELLEAAVQPTGLCVDGEWAQVDILNWLGRAHAEVGEEAASRAYFESALERSPDNHWVRLAMEGAGYRWEG